jgi:hypothetical protein
MKSKRYGAKEQQDFFFAWKNSKTYVATSATLNTTKND